MSLQVVQHNHKYQNTDAIFFPKPQLLFEYLRKKKSNRKALLMFAKYHSRKKCHQSCLWLVSLLLIQLSLAGDCASGRLLPSYTFASGLSPSSWPLASWRVGPLDLCHPFYLSLGLYMVTHQTCLSFETNIFGGFETYDRTLQCVG